MIRYVIIIALTEAGRQIPGMAIQIRMRGSSVFHVNEKKLVHVEHDAVNRIHFESRFARLSLSLPVKGA